MKRNNISPEFTYNNIEGSFNMIEQKSFSASKMMKIEDDIILDNRDIVYYQQLNYEQLNLNQEINFSSIIYSITEDKKDNMTFSIDTSQSDYERQNKTKWKMVINLNSILRNYIFAQLKSSRCFEGIKNESTKYKNINSAINGYIDDNILNRYEFETLTLYIKYKSLEDNDNLRYDNTYNYQINSSDNIFKKVNITTSMDESFIICKFTQEENSNEYNFDYYYDLKFKRK